MVSHLIEPGVHYFYKKTLQGCHHVKERYYNGLYEKPISDLETEIENLETRPKWEIGEKIK